MRRRADPPASCARRSILLWNGGIGTFVKASTETTPTPSDRATTRSAWTASQVRARSSGRAATSGSPRRGASNTRSAAADQHRLHRQLGRRRLLRPRGQPEDPAREVAIGRMTVEERNRVIHDLTEQVSRVRSYRRADPRSQSGHADRWHVRYHGLWTLSSMAELAERRRPPLPPGDAGAGWRTASCGRSSRARVHQGITRSRARPHFGDAPWLERTCKSTSRVYDHYRTGSQPSAWRDLNAACHEHLNSLARRSLPAKGELKVIGHRRASASHRLRGSAPAPGRAGHPDPSTGSGRRQGSVGATRWYLDERGVREADSSPSFFPRRRVLA